MPSHSTGGASMMRSKSFGRRQNRSDNAPARPERPGRIAGTAEASAPLMAPASPSRPPPHPVELVAVEGEAPRLAFGGNGLAGRQRGVETQAFGVEGDAGGGAEIVERHHFGGHAVAARCSGDADRFGPEAAPALLAGIALHEI